MLEVVAKNRRDWLWPNGGIDPLNLQSKMGTFSSCGVDRQSGGWRSQQRRRYLEVRGIGGGGIDRSCRRCNRRLRGDVVAAGRVRRAEGACFRDVRGRKR